MRKLSAHYIFTGTGVVLNKGIIIVNEEGIVTKIIDTKGQFEEQSGVEFYSGAIVPGFVNAHCHLELSHLHSIFPEKTGLPGFLKNVVANRNHEEPIVLEAARKADFELWHNGIVAVGDISNTASTFALKSKSKIKYHTFIEVLGFSPLRAQRAFEWAEICLAEARSLGIPASIVPHAPYSISKELFALVSKSAEDNHSILSIHSQECSAEDDLYQTGEGELTKHLTENLSMDISFFEPTGKNALESVIDWLPEQNKLLLVHNVCTVQKDIDLLRLVRDMGKTWFVLCPNSNLYIDKQLPDIALFSKNGLKICLGTDSLSSNWKLSILEEMKTIHRFFPEIHFGEMVTWATLNGAEALEMDSWAGSIEVGKKPGLNLITGLDLNSLQLLPQSKVKRLIN